MPSHLSNIARILPDIVFDVFERKRERRAVLTLLRDGQEYINVNARQRNDNCIEKIFLISTRYDSKTSDETRTLVKKIQKISSLSFNK